MTSERIREIVESEFRNRFHDIDIVAINIRPGFGHAGNPIVRVTVVYDASVEQLLERGTLELREVVRNKVQEDPKQDPGFPILSFIASSDLGKRSPETA